MTFLLNNILLKTTFIFHSTNNFTMNAVEPLTNVMITIVLIMLILLSLILTFSRNSEAIHKVLGLLLVSVFVVFLWIYQTEFLFVYLVYILAFIGAVLMLFLSVVLMLPISTIQKNKSLSSKSLLLLSFINLGTSFEKVIYFFVYLAFFYYIISIAYISFDLIKRKSLTQVLSSFILQITPSAAFLKITSKIKNFINNNSKTKLFININLYLNFIRVFFLLFFKDLINVYNCFFKFNSLLIICQLVLVVFFESIKIQFNKLSINFVEFVLQLVIFINLIIILIPVFFYEEKNYLVLFNKEDLSIAGLGNIKYLLYENNPLFLIISTLVLLVALIGAAVMTRNKQ